MANPNKCDLTQDCLFYGPVGLIERGVCAPAAWTAERVEAEVNRVDPPGTRANRWVVSTPQEGESNPVQCDDDPNRRHWILNC